MANSSKSYEELHGSNNWDGLLDPMDSDLRNVILSYGDLASASERVLNTDPGSRNVGYSRYGKSTFFQGLTLPSAESKYNVTSFLYATARDDFALPILVHNSHTLTETSDDYDTNWMGYVAVSNDEYTKSIGRREICVVWRGTARELELVDDIQEANPVPADPLLPPKSVTGLIGSDTDQPMVMSGWLIIYTTVNPYSDLVKTSARTQLWEKIKDLLVKYKGEKISITCTGHSLGASLATLSAFDLAANVVTPDIMVSAFVFASPQVGNQAFKSKMEELPNLKVMSIKNDNDLVPKWPSKILEWIDENTGLVVPDEFMSYVDVGIDLLIDSKWSPFLKKNEHLHDLEIYLHIVAGYKGKDMFDPEAVEALRGLASVNMTGDFLIDEYQIPLTWWAENNKGMALNESGIWVLPPLDWPDHDLSPPNKL
ncbi:hypothetical protein OSB04_004983 [Centaurea solstitialis]|uniref:Phospholipase A1 n=1 Tax=Centaurea solstitialis TaxID=347529 RepID=A0AA38TZS7_9ASTR|nr:hypothetical protein OSB04_004983 [Centaurea solstitialis]